MESTENRYAHLLQPIRELTKNWEIDLASELNDYLEELDDMCITFDGGRTRLNFAEAALLIQGSTCIYSKKVELLYSLVFHTLECISNNDNNRRRGREAADAQQGAAEGTQSAAADLEEFSPLDLEASQSSQRAELLAEVGVVPLPPEALIPPEAHEKQRLPLISLQGEVVCSHKDFRINLFLPGPDHLILLIQSAAASRFLLDQTLGGCGTQQPAAALEPGEAEDPDTDQCADQDVDQDPEEHVERQQLSARSDGPTIRERRQVEAEQQEHQEHQEPAAAVSAWTLHDPYAALGEDRPFKPGKCYRVPDGLDDGGKRKRRRAAPLQDFRAWFRGSFEPPEPRLKAGPSFPDLNYVYLNTMKDRLKKQSRICRRLGVVLTEEQLRRTLLQPEEAEPQQLWAGPEDELLDGGGSDDEPGVPDDVFVEAAGGPDFFSAAPQRDDLTYEELVKLRVEQLVANSRGYTQESALFRRVQDWEELIRPELLLQERRPPFDIHSYGERIVAALGAVGRRKSFASVVRGLDNYEACKFLLAALQLANDYTVEVDSGGGLEDGLDSMGLTLLSTSRATDRFKALAASS